MKYVRSVESLIKDNGSKELVIKLTDKECFLFDDVYMLVENYKNKVDTIFLWAIDSEDVEITFNAKKISAYDIKSILEKLA